MYEYITERPNYKMKIFPLNTTRFERGENTHTRWTLYANWEAQTTRTTNKSCVLNRTKYHPIDHSL